MIILRLIYEAECVSRLLNPHMSGRICFCLSFLYVCVRDTLFVLLTSSPKCCRGTQMCVGDDNVKCRSAQSCVCLTYIYVDIVERKCWNSSGKLCVTGYVWYYSGIPAQIMYLYGWQVIKMKCVVWSRHVCHKKL